MLLLSSKAATNRTGEFKMEKLKQTFPGLVFAAIFAYAAFRIWVMSGSAFHFSGM